MKIANWPIDKPIPYARNPRINAESIDTVAASIQEFGFRQPIVVDDDGVILVGHTRLKAAHKLNLKTVPVHVASGLTESQRKAYRIMDNRASHASDWDAEMLALEIDDLDADGYDLDLTGFDTESLDELLAGSEGDEEDANKDTEPQDDRAEELREQWGVETGQLWVLGDHRLLCGDSTVAADVARVTSGVDADACLTDPPYGQNQPGVNGDTPEQHVKLMTMFCENMPITDGIVVAFQSPRTFHNFTDAARLKGFLFERMLWMYKAAQCTFPWRGWILKSESIVICSIGKPEWHEVKPFAHDCYYLSEVSGELDENSGWHGSVKPMSVVSDLLSRISAVDSIVYEPFSGSGTTIIACENLGRKCRAIEINPAYVAVALQRWADHTGQTPILDNG